jgi:ABC-type transporter Mla MlaB component
MPVGISIKVHRRHADGRSLQRAPRTMKAPCDDMTPASLKLPADVAAAGPEVLRRGLLEAGVGRHTLQLDGSEVVKIDFGSWQILCAAFRDAARAGTSLSWSGTSLYLRTTAARLGIAALLGTGGVDLPKEATT